METVKCKVVHSQSKSAWNIIGETPGSKFKIARIPYISEGSNEIILTKEKHEALVFAEFMCKCLNNAEKISKILN